jgi:cyclic pyranopterin phosphate synthase
MSAESFSHLNAEGDVRMVDVSSKPPLRREAVAAGHILVQASTLDRMEAQEVAKGNVLATARIAGIQAAKRTGEWIPLCHPLAITHCEVQFAIPSTRDRVEITARVSTVGPTGVEMEALTAVSAAALTIYDMCKALDKGMEIGGVRLVEKTKRPL